MQEEEKRKLRTWVRVAQVYQKSFRLLADRLSRVGLSVAQFDLLSCLVVAEPERLKQSELANRLLVTKGNISGMLSRMTELGTVERADDPYDKRKKRITITAEGRELYEAGRAIQDALVFEILEDVSGQRLEVLDEIASEICETIDLAKAR